MPPNAAARLPHSDDWADISADSGKLKCTCASTPPGTTSLPDPSMRRLASTSTAPGDARKATLPSRMPTSMRATDVEETTSPSVISRSIITTPKLSASGMACLRQGCLRQGGPRPARLGESGPAREPR